MQLETDSRTVGPEPSGKRPRIWPAILVCCLLFTTYEIAKPFAFELQIEISSSTSSVAQLFFNRGKGYTEADSVAVQVDATAPNKFQKLSFRLSGANIYSLRFDPLTADGTVTIRNAKIVAGSQNVLQIKPSQIIPFHEIQSIVRESGQAIVKTTDRANDPGVQMVLTHPLNYKRLLIAQKGTTVVIGNLVLIALGLLVRRKRNEIGKKVRAAFSMPHHRLQKIATRISADDFIHFDAYALWFYLACFAVFLCASLADLNGSSLGLYQAVHGQRPDNLLGTPRPVRSDEWAYGTPIMMNQSLRADRFAFRHSVTGDHSAALIASIPVKHISTLFRPQFWSFFVLPLDYAFAVFWQGKAFLLLCGVFTWLLLLTGSTFWSAAGALWYFFSPFTQWTYSWSSLLPESVGLSCVAMVLCCFLTVGRNRIALAVSALGLATCAIDFAMCAYLPHLIPLFWLGSFFFVGWCITHRAFILRKQDRLPRIAAWAGTLLIVSFIGFSVYVDVKDTITGIANTVYPGKRVFSGGNTPPELLLSQFLNWTSTEQHLPPVLGNICEAAGFLWLAPVTIFSAARLELSRQKKNVLISLWCFFLFLLAWMLLPIPAALGKLFALDKTGGPRCLPALGLANIAIVAVCSTACFRHRVTPQEPGGNRRLLSGNTLRAVGIFFVLFVILWQSNRLLGGFYSGAELVLATALTTLFVIFMLLGRTKALAIALVTSQAADFGLVNPVQRGLTPITQSEAFSFFQTHRELLRHKWILFADGAMAPGFLEAMGCDEYTGLHFVPDIDHFQLFKARGLDMAAINSLGYFLAHAIDKQTPSYVKRIQTGVAQLYISPTDPLLRQLGIEYAAFDGRPDPSIAAGLILIRETPVSNIWLYRLP